MQPRSLTPCPAMLRSRHFSDPAHVFRRQVWPGAAYMQGNPNGALAIDLPLFHADLERVVS